MNNIALIGIDLGKHSFHVHCQDNSGRALIRKKYTRAKLFEFLANTPSAKVVMEACAYDVAAAPQLPLPETHSHCHQLTSRTTPCDRLRCSLKRRCIAIRAIFLMTTGVSLSSFENF